MAIIEFETELQGGSVLPLPSEVASQLPSSGPVRVIVLVEGEDLDDEAWRRLAYEQFMRDDDPEDAVYDTYP